MTGVGVYSVARIDHDLDAIRGQNLQRARKRRFRQRMRIAADEQRSVDALLRTVETDGLGDCEDVRLIEGVVGEDPRCPEVPNTTRCPGTEGSGRPV